MQKLDIRDISIIDAFPLHNLTQDFILSLLTVGCGECRLEKYLADKFPDWYVHATDIMDKNPNVKNTNVEYLKMDIFSPQYNGEVVVCSQVLEHLRDWKTAFTNLLKITKDRLIITVPYMHSFHSPDHVNFWNDESIQEFKIMAMPYSTAISKIRTKPEDVEMGQSTFLIVVDKKQKYGV